jgi:hypothetical protein
MPHRGPRALSSFVEREAEMTAIAATRIQGSPVLFGDVLLTAKAAPGSTPYVEPAPGAVLPPSYYPMNPLAAAQLPENKGYRVAGSRRKAVLINDRLCVAWTDSAFGAAQLIRELKVNFCNRYVSIDVLQQFLSSYDDFKGTLSFHLIGWLVDDKFHCFRWNSEWPIEIFEGDEHYGGSERQF